MISLMQLLRQHLVSTNDEICSLGAVINLKKTNIGINGMDFKICQCHIPSPEC